MDAINFKNKKAVTIFTAVLLSVFSGVGATYFGIVYNAQSHPKAILSDVMALPDNSAFMQILHVRNIGKNELDYVSISIRYVQTVQPIDFKCASIAKNVESIRSQIDLKLRYERLPTDTGITCIFLSSLGGLKINRDDVLIATPVGKFDSNDIRKENYQ